MYAHIIVPLAVAVAAARVGICLDLYTSPMNFKTRNNTSKTSFHGISFSWHAVQDVDNDDNGDKLHLLGGETRDGFSCSDTHFNVFLFPPSSGPYYSYSSGKIITLLNPRTLPYIYGIKLFNKQF